MHISTSEEEASENAELARAAAARAQVYGLLRSVLNELPSAERIKDLVESPTLRAAIGDDAAGEQALAAIRSWIAHEGVASLVTSVAVERTRLLRGIAPGYGPPPACESAYVPADQPERNGSSTALTSAALLAEFGRAGFCPDRRYSPDFLGNQLGFVEFLVGREALAWKRGEQDLALVAACEQYDFLCAHIDRWIVPLLRMITAESSHGFWPAVLTLIASHLRQENEYLKQLLQIEAGPSRDAGH